MTNQIADPATDLPALREALRAWLRDHEVELQPYRHEIVGDIPQMQVHVRPLQRLLFDAGWTRLGWPVEVGGLGGSAVMRAELMEEFAAAGYSFPDLLATITTALGVDPKKENMSNVGRPIPLTDRGGTPIADILTTSAG